MKSRRSFVVAVAALLLGAAHARAEDASPKGWLVFSIAADINYTSAQLRIRQVGGSATKYLMGFTNWSSLKGLMVELAPGKTGYVTAKELPAGPYEIINYRLEYPASNTEFTNRGDFSVAFDVKPGEVVYLGEFLATAVMTKPFLGLRNVDRPYFIYSDQRERDVALAAKANPGIAGLAVEKARFKVTGHPPFTKKRLPQPEEAGSEGKP